MSTVRIDPEYLLRQAQALVRINSINPAFTGGATDERHVADFVATQMRGIGFDTERVEPEPGRASIIARRKGTHTGAPSVMLYGRGAFDMKGSLAACMAAARALTSHGARAGDIILAAVADEEVASIGMQAVLKRCRPDYAIVTEPTDLQLCLAHKGFAWIEVQTFGRAAHGSRFEDGIDANLRMGRFLARLEGLERGLRTERVRHQLLGPPSLHAGVLHGGTGASTYSSRCRVEIERRMLPSETEEGVLAEVQTILDELKREDPTFEASARILLARPPYESGSESPLARATRAAAESVTGRSPAIVGVSYWMDTALLAAAGVDTVCIGPAGDGAHAAVEWVDVQSLETLAAILVETAMRVSR